MKISKLKLLMMHLYNKQCSTVFLVFSFTIYVGEYYMCNVTNYSYLSTAHSVQL